jgi:hypothetical protein
MAKVLSNLEGTHLLHSDGLSTGFSSRSFAPLFCAIRIYTEFFDDSVFCPFEGIFWSKSYSNRLFGPAAPSRYSRNDFGPSNCSLRAGSALKIFEERLWSLELLPSGRQRPQDIRGRTLVPRIAPFGPAAPSRYSRKDFGPSNCSFRAGSALKIFEEGLWSLELLLSGRQRPQDIRGRTLVPRIVLFGPAAPSRCSRQGFGPSDYPFRASSAFEIFEVRLRSFESPFWPSDDFKEFELEL